MPLNKNAFLRYQVIDACLNNKFHPYPSMEVLIEKCSEKIGGLVSKSTVEKDIHAMKYLDPPGFEAPISFDKYNNGYYYTDPNYSIIKIKVNDEDIDAIEFAAKILRQYRGFHIVKRYAEAIDRILDVVDVRRILEDNELDEIVQLETYFYVRGTQFIEPVVRAIKEKKVLHFNYLAFPKSTVELRTLHPYLLKEFRSRWYIVGLDNEKNEIRTFGLDRITSLVNELNDEKISFKQVPFSPNEYFRNTIGVIAPQTHPPKIILAFNKNDAQYLITQPIHHSQELVRTTKNEVIFSFLLHPTYEFLALLHSYQDGVRILAPKKLKVEFKEMLYRMLKKYE
jgi:predicted DNA-binding transcriptional regulator YafY